MAYKILVNDGLHPAGLTILQEAGFELHTEKVEQADLPKKLPSYDVICVRSATKVRADLIEQCPNLKIIARGGVGLDNIDVDFAKARDIHVINTPGASSRSVAELAMSHLMSIARFLYQSNRAMPKSGGKLFKELKKSYAKGFELEGRTLGIIGLGRIGQELARIALGMGMDVMAVDPYVLRCDLRFQIGKHTVHHPIWSVDLADLLSKADVISLHVPFTGRAVLGAAEFDQMKDGVVLINVARGGTVDEDALLAALESGKVAAAGLDVFENEPTPKPGLLKHPRLSLTPHIGASTVEAQAKIGVELAEQIVALLK